LFASARVTIDMDVVVEEGRIIRVQPKRGNDFAQAGVTRRVDCTSGAITGEKTASPRGVVVSFDSSSVAVHGGAANPFYGSHPKIVFDLRLRLDVSQARFSLAGSIAAFPAFEGYYSIDGGPPGTLFQLLPAPGSSAFDLIAGGAREISAVIPLPNE
jgi:hypothetical protein